MPKLDKAERRDRKREKNRKGMRVHGKNIHILAEAQEKRDRERRKRSEWTDGNDSR
jgi:hypothetical protein